MMKILESDNFPVKISTYSNTYVCKGKAFITFTYICWQIERLSVRTEAVQFQVKRNHVLIITKCNNMKRHSGLKHFVLSPSRFEYLREF